MGFDYLGKVMKKYGLSFFGSQHEVHMGFRSIGLIMRCTMHMGYGSLGLFMRCAWALVLRVTS